MEWRSRSGALRPICRRPRTITKGSIRTSDGSARRPPASTMVFLRPGPRPREEKEYPLAVHGALPGHPRSPPPPPVTWGRWGERRRRHPVREGSSIPQEGEGVEVVEKVRACRYSATAGRGAGLVEGAPLEGIVQGEGEMGIVLSPRTLTVPVFLRTQEQPGLPEELPAGRPREAKAPTQIRFSTAERRIFRKGSAGGRSEGPEGGRFAPAPPRSPPTHRYPNAGRNPSPTGGSGRSPASLSDGGRVDGRGGCRSGREGADPGSPSAVHSTAMRSRPRRRIRFPCAGASFPGRPGVEPPWRLVVERATIVLGGVIVPEPGD